jgi:hypothetical protein
MSGPRAAVTVAARRPTNFRPTTGWPARRCDGRRDDKERCNSGRGNGSETEPANDCDPGNSGGHNIGGDWAARRILPGDGGRPVTGWTRAAAVPRRCAAWGDSYTGDMPALAVGAAAVLVLTVVAFVGRVAAVAALSSRRPQAAAVVDRYWVWLPVLAIASVVAVLLWPAGPVLAAAAIALVIARPDVFGLPPRRPGGSGPAR